MARVIIDMTISLDGYVAGPDDGPAFPLGKHGGRSIFDWYNSGVDEYRSPLFKPAPGANLDEVKRMFDESGAFVFGRRTYDITHGWGGRHPVGGAPVFVLTHRPPSAESVPKGPSNLQFVTDGIESAIRAAKAAAGHKHVKLGGASAAKQALGANLVDENPRPCRAVPPRRRGAPLRRPVGWRPPREGQRHRRTARDTSSVPRPAIEGAVSGSGAPRSSLRGIEGPRHRKHDSRGLVSRRGGRTRRRLAGSRTPRSRGRGFGEKSTTAVLPACPCARRACTSGPYAC